MIKEREALREQVVDDYTEDKENQKELSNILYSIMSVKGIPEEENTFLVGGEDSCIKKVRVDFDRPTIIDNFIGSSRGIRQIEMSRDN